MILSLVKESKHSCKRPCGGEGGQGGIGFLVYA